MGYTLLLSLIEYKTLVMRGDLERANEVLPTIPKEHQNRLELALITLMLRRNNLLVLFFYKLVHKFETCFHRRVVRCKFSCVKLITMYYIACHNFSSIIYFGMIP